MTEPKDRLVQERAEIVAPCRMIPRHTGKFQCERQEYCATTLDNAIKGQGYRSGPEAGLRGTRRKKLRRKEYKEKRYKVKGA